MAKEKVTILGGAGYIGSWVTRILLESKYGGTILDLFLLGRRHMDPLLKRYPNLSVHCGDMRSASDLAEVVKTPMWWSIWAVWLATRLAASTKTRLGCTT